MKSSKAKNALLITGIILAKIGLIIALFVFVLYGILGTFTKSRLEIKSGKYYAEENEIIAVLQITEVDEARYLQADGINSFSYTYDKETEYFLIELSFYYADERERTSLEFKDLSYTRFCGHEPLIYYDDDGNNVRPTSVAIIVDVWLPDESAESGKTKYVFVFRYSDI